MRFVIGLSPLLALAAAVSCAPSDVEEEGPLGPIASTSPSASNPTAATAGAPSNSSTGPADTALGLSPTNGGMTTLASEAAPASSAPSVGSGGSSEIGPTSPSPASADGDAGTGDVFTEGDGLGAVTPTAPDDDAGLTVIHGADASDGISSSEQGSDGETVDSDGGDDVAPRPLAVTAPKQRHEHRFRAIAADPEVAYNDNDQIAVFDNRAATLMGKLVLTFGGAGETKGNLTGGGEFCARRGFHVLAVAAFQAYNIVIHGPDFYGDARRTVFEGVMHTRQDAFASIELTEADGVARRTQKALQYLHATYPEEDWGYYLQADGSVRWSDVIFTGVSHGASNSARFASLVRASRVVSIAGPRDNLCERIDVADCGGEVATWLSEVPKTPIDRFYAITGVQDEQHTQHLFAMEKLGYVGEPTRIDGAAPPYANSRRLVSAAGHDDFCGQPAYQNACNYVFGVPPENHAGTSL